MDKKQTEQWLKEGKTVLGIELGSTRIKAQLIGPDNVPLAAGSYEWENKLEDNIWTYALEDVWTGLQAAYADLTKDVQVQYQVTLKQVGAIGISAMMHGYLVFDKNEKLLVPFRTWRNTMTAQASAELTKLFDYPIPQRWSISHLYQAILNQEKHVPEMDFITTLAGYVHWKLTGRKVIGIGDASGMFPIDMNSKNYYQSMIGQFDELLKDKNYPWKLQEILPEILVAGEDAGTLTAEGACLLDPSGQLQAGIPLCPPEGDAQTGMAATGSVAKRTGNVSAGTSVFSMVVLEKELSRAYSEIDLVTTPTGDLVAMVHCNNCTSDLNAWVNLFGEFAESFGIKADKNALFSTLYNKALEGDADCGGLLAYNYVSGESITGFEEGRPLFARTPDAKFTLANFMRVHLVNALATLKIGMDILLKQENVKVDCLLGHGGFFKTKGVGQRIMAAAANTPVSVMETAGEGGAWGIALLASYLIHKEEEETLEHYLAEKVFAGETGSVMKPDEADVEGFNHFMEQYMKGLSIEKAAVEAMNERRN